MSNADEKATPDDEWPVRPDKHRTVPRPADTAEYGYTFGRIGTWAFLLFVVVMLVALMIPRVSSRDASPRSQCKNNLKQIGLALHNYHDKYKCFPPAYVADEHGRPMHSWRVLLLPYLDAQGLYDQYRFDQRWDGPDNRRLADQVVHVYNCPSEDHADRKKGSTMTSYVAVVGPETVWPGTDPISIRDVTDGSTQTLQVVEIADSGIHWMEPRDLHVLQMAPTINAKAGQGMSSRHKGCAQGLLCDGTVHIFDEKMPAESLRAWLTARAGDRGEDK
ncbi:MAG: DUF1559 domain-containing protein [Deltaproteobacteria bacterium]